MPVPPGPPGIDYSSSDQGEKILLTQVFAVSPTATWITVESPAFHPVRTSPFTVLGLTFSRDGHTLLSASGDHRIISWALDA